MRWGGVYAQISLQLSTASLFLGGIVVALVKVIASIVPFYMSGLLIALAPIASTLALQTIPLERLRTHGECRWTQPGALRPLLPLAAAIALFFLLWSVFNMILKTSTGHYSLGPEASFPLGLVTHLLVVGILALVAYGFLGHGRSFDFHALWRLLYVFLAVSLLATVYLGISQVIQVCTSAAIELGFVFFWMLTVDVTRHSSLPSQAILGFGGLLQAIPDWAGRSLVALFDIQELGSHAIAILFFVIVATVAFLLPHRSPTVQLLFSEVNAEKPQTSERASLEEACAHLSAKAGLSQREEEILELLCRGRSKPYIAETLFLSENTVRTYTRSMYRKLNVNSKQELLDLAEDEAERSG